MGEYLPAADRYTAMHYRRCGRSGLRLPPLSLGLWQNFGGVDSFENGRAVIRRAFDLGITHFDLANNYGPPAGSAEENFGRILQADLRPHRDELVISTKAGFDMWPGPYGEWGSRKYLLASLDQSLARMDIDYVDIFYSHRPDPDTPLEETVGALEHAVRVGKALYVGISNYDAAQTQAALAAFAGPCLPHQMPYSLLRRSAEDGLFDVLRSAGVGAIAYSPLAQGLLSNRYLDGIPPDSRAGRIAAVRTLTAADLSAARRAQIHALAELAAARGQSLAQMAIAWALRIPGMSSVVVGPSRVEQLEDSVGSLRNLEFSADQLAKIDVITHARH